MLEKRLDLVSIAGAMFMAGYITCAAVNHVQQLWSEHGQLAVVKTTVLPKLAAKANCEHRRAENNEAVAKEAIRGALVDNAPIPPLSDVQDNCHPK